MVGFFCGNFSAKIVYLYMCKYVNGVDYGKAFIYGWTSPL